MLPPKTLWDSGTQSCLHLPKGTCRRYCMGLEYRRSLSVYVVSVQEKSVSCEKWNKLQFTTNATLHLINYLERSLTSRYQGSRSSGSQQLFLVKMAIYIAKQWKKSIGCFVPDYSHAQESHTCQFFRFFLSYLRDHDVLKSRNFATMATWGDNFSSETL